MSSNRDIAAACSALDIANLSLLGLSGKDPTKELKTLRDRLARKHHPDKFTDSREKEEATTKMANINDAYNLLVNELSRRKNDREL